MLLFCVVAHNLMSDSWACVVAGTFVDARAKNVLFTQTPADSVISVFDNEELLEKIINFNYNDMCSTSYDVCYRIQYMYKKIKKQRTLVLYDTVFQNVDLLLLIFSNYSFLEKLNIWKTLPQFRKYLNVKCPMCNKLPRNPVRINIFNAGLFKTCPKSMIQPSCKICVRRSFNLTTRKKDSSTHTPIRVDYSCAHGCCNGVRVDKNGNILHGYKTYGTPGRIGPASAEQILWTMMDDSKLGIVSLNGREWRVPCPKCGKKCLGQIDLDKHLYHACIG